MNIGAGKNKYTGTLHHSITLGRASNISFTVPVRIRPRVQTIATTQVMVENTAAR